MKIKVPRSVTSDVRYFGIKLRDLIMGLTVMMIGSLLRANPYWMIVFACLIFSFMSFWEHYREKILGLLHWQIAPERMVLGEHLPGRHE